MKRKLNLVYDDWSGDKPKPNGVKIYGDLFWDGEMLIRNYYDRGLGFGYYEDQFPEESDRFETVKCKLEDVKQNPNEKYYYILDYFRFGLCKALASTPPESTFPELGVTVLYARANLVIESNKITTSFFISTSLFAFSITISATLT